MSCLSLFVKAIVLSVKSKELTYLISLLSSTKINALYIRMNTDDDTSYLVGFINVNYSVYKEFL